MGGSRHSLYPSVVCVDQKAEAFDRSESIISNQSDFIKSNNDDVIEDNNEDYESETSRLIPLADLKNELKLSAISISSSSCRQAYIIKDIFEVQNIDLKPILKTATFKLTMC